MWFEDKWISEYVSHSSRDWYQAYLVSRPCFPSFCVRLFFITELMLKGYWNLAHYKLRRGILFPLVILSGLLKDVQMLFLDILCRAIRHQDLLKIHVLKWKIGFKKKLLMAFLYMTLNQRSRNKVSFKTENHFNTSYPSTF